MTETLTTPNLTTNEASCVTGVPLRQVHRIIDAGLLDAAAQGGDGVRRIIRDGLVGLKVAYETTDMLTLDGRRRLVRYLLKNPAAVQARDRGVSVDVRSIKSDVRQGLILLARARETVSCDADVLCGTPCIKGTCIPAHDVAEMLANGDSARSIQMGLPQLSETQIELAAFYARAYPRRGRPPRKGCRRERNPVASNEIALDELPLVRRSS